MANGFHTSIQKQIAQRSGMTANGAAIAWDSMSVNVWSCPGRRKTFPAATWCRVVAFGDRKLPVE